MLKVAIPSAPKTLLFAIASLYKFVKISLLIVDLLNSFCKGNQKVLKVEIYPSEYGLKEMAKENEQGPDKEIFNTEAIVKTGEDKKAKGSLHQTVL